MQDIQGGPSLCRQDIYNAALAELEKLQREIDFEKVDSERTQKQKRARQQTLLAGGVLLSSLMSAVTVQVMHDAPRPLSQPESSAIHNLVDYVAMRQAANDRWVNHALCAHFSVSRIDELSASDYDAAVFYLLKLAQD